MHHHDCSPPFGFWMGGRHGWGGGWGRHGGRGRRGGRDAGFFANMFGDQGPRAERGGVKYLVLDAVADAPRHGYEIMQVIEERSKGAYRPSPGVVYPTLQLLDEMGFLRSTEKDGRKTYEITDEGRRELEQNRETVSGFYEQQDGAPWEVYAEELADFSERLIGLVNTVKRAARHGRFNAKTVRELRTILDETIARVEAVFGQDRTR